MLECDKILVMARFVFAFSLFLHKFKVKTSAKLIEKMRTLFISYYMGVYKIKSNKFVLMSNKFTV